MISIAFLAFIIFITIKRNKELGKPVFTYRHHLIEDRYIEWMSCIIIGLTLLFSTIVQAVTRRDFILSLFSILLIVGITLWDYQRNKVGIFEHGILYRSVFTPFKRMYTFRSFDLTDGKIKIKIYVRKRIDPESLDSFVMVFDKKTGERWEEELDKIIDRNIKVIERK